MSPQTKLQISVQSKCCLHFKPQFNSLKNGIIILLWRDGVKVREIIYVKCLIQFLNNWQLMMSIMIKG